ncbi:MAG: hypothetical protein MUO63_02515 [Desulfobulbaceae bacterium]|nr:hypothetical protein [Desulfobulbaceae bacterium]
MKKIKSILATLVSIVIFFILTGIIEFLFRFLDEIRGSKFLLQDIWSSVLAAGIAGYISAKAIRYIFINFHKITYLITYSAFLLIFLVFSLYLMVPVASEAGFGFKEFSIQILTPICAMVSVYIALEDYAEENSVEDNCITDDDFV